ncbi:MAG: diacylglycerol kinase family protein [Pseudomonadota bacterium]|nr:diacylglycerol kinase family protein [Pseudomonadota bacterium]
MATSIYEFAQLPEAAPTSALRAGRRARSAGEAPRVGVIFNPRSHRNRDSEHETLDCPNVQVAKPWDRAELPEALAQFAENGIDLLIINGGDGTVRDVLTCGQGVFGDDWPALAVLPKGKTNALTVDLDVPPEWDEKAAIAAFDNGARLVRRPIEVRELSKKQGSRVLGFILGAGAFAHATETGQSAHKLGAFNSAVVAVTALWGLMQALFAGRSNPWRRGSRMSIKLGSRRTEMTHSGKGDAAYRQLLFATTLERLPAGLNPFGALRTGLRLIAVDQLSRWMTPLLPFVATGKKTKGLREKGIHPVSVSEFTLEIDDAFIFDGEAFPAGEYQISQGPMLEFVTPLKSDQA